MTGAERIAFEHGRRVVLDRRDAETRQRRAFRAYVDQKDRDYTAARTVELERSVA